MPNYIMRYCLRWPQAICIPLGNTQPFIYVFQRESCIMWDPKKMRRGRWWLKLRGKGRFFSTATSTTSVITWDRRRLSTGSRASTTGWGSSRMWWTGWVHMSSPGCCCVSITVTLHHRNQVLWLFQIKVCETCQHTERKKNLARTVRPIKVEAPWDIIAIDLIGFPSSLFLWSLTISAELFVMMCLVLLPSASGPFPETQQGNKSITLILDYFSKWPEAFPMQKTDPLSVARCISKCIYR